MKIEKGDTRRVFVFKNIVIKCARIYWYKALKNTTKTKKLYFKLFLELGSKEYFLRIRTSKEKRLRDRIQWEKDLKEKEKKEGMRIPEVKRYECYGTTAICLMEGVMANIQEWRFYRKTKHAFVMPTYFSFFGLFNIQKRGQEINFWKGVDVWHYIHQHVQNHAQPFCDGHTLAEIYNFCLDDGHLKIVDYGSRRLEPFIEINGQRLYDNFKPPE
jgi:hypothetical protein